MYSLIKYTIANHCNDDIASLIFRLYKDIILEITRRCDGCLYNDRYACRHVRHIIKISYCSNIIVHPSTHLYKYCHSCYKKIFAPVYRCLTYIVHKYEKNYPSKWEYNGSVNDELYFHIDCFRERFGVIYDF